MDEVSQKSPEQNQDRVRGVLTELLQQQELIALRIRSVLHSLNGENNEPAFLELLGNSVSIFQSRLVTLQQTLYGFIPEKGSGYILPISPVVIEDEDFVNDPEFKVLPDSIMKGSQAWMKLSPKAKEKVSYYEKGGEWLVNIGGIEVTMENETAPEDRERGIRTYTSPSFPQQTYFTHDAAVEQASARVKQLPTEDDIIQMTNTLGDDQNLLPELLQIPLIGSYFPLNALYPHELAISSSVWLSDVSKNLRIYNGIWSFISPIDPQNGHSVRLVSRANQ